MTTRPNTNGDLSSDEQQAWQADVDALVSRVVQTIARDELELARDGLERLAKLDPSRRASYVDAQRCIAELRANEATRALLQLHFGLGRDEPSTLTDALAQTIADRFATTAQGDWEALAWTFHSAGKSAIAKLFVTDVWLEKQGPEALENAVFELADAQAGVEWLALSAWLAAREYPLRHPEQTIVTMAEAATVSAPDSPRVASLCLRTLTQLDLESQAMTLLEKLAQRWADAPDQWLELLDGIEDDTFSKGVLDQAYRDMLDTRASSLNLRASIIQRREFLDARSRVEAPSTASESVIVGLLRRDPAAREAQARAMANAILGAPPQRDDAEWRATKARGDAKFRRWLYGVWIFVGLGVLMLFDWLR